MKIPVPEIEERYDSLEDAFKHLIRLCEMIVSKAKVVYPSISVSDIPGYLLAICDKILIQSKTFLKLVRDKVDYSTSAAVLRVLADNITVVRVVYGVEDSNERSLRHFLYVLDGVSLRKRNLDLANVSYDGKIPVTVYNALCNQIKNAKENAQGCMDFCISEIKKMDVYSSHITEVEALIESGNWKFKKIDKAGKKNAYTWKEMYALLELKQADTMFSYLSQYVHGLSVSNITLDDEDDFEALLSFGYCLVGWLLNFLKKEYGSSIGEYTWDDIQKMLFKEM